MAKKVLITGGSGLVGKRLTTLLLQKGYEVAYLTRKRTNIPSVSVFEWDVKNNYIEPGALENTDYLIHLAGAGVADERWSEKRKKEIFSSRTDSIQLIAQQLKLKKITPKSFVSASGSSYYGEDTGDIQHTEQSPPGTDFLSEVTIAWEKSADEVAALGVRTVKLRTGIVLSNDGGAVPKMALPAKLGFGAPLGSGKQWLSWIHIDDLCQLYIQAMENNIWQGAYNAVATPPATNEYFTRQICKALNKPQWLPNVPAFALRLVFGEMANVVLGSNYVINQRIQDETDFTYKYPDLLEALKNVLKS
jgi:uncharacterized protein (TIGR01777 family)